jgi:DNA-binding transcriptional LysR family regulator
MKSFVAVADTGSFSAAAHRLEATQSTVSKHVAALERHLQTRLIQRTTRSVVLSPAGAVFYESAVVALAAIDEAEAAVGRISDARGVLRITAPLSLVEGRLMAMLSGFLAGNPGIEIDLTLSDHALNLVADNLDLAVRVGHIDDARLVSRKIGLARRVAVASPAYLRARGRPRVPADLVAHNCIAYSLSNAGMQWRFSDNVAVPIAGSMRADSPNALRAAVLADVGIAVNAVWLFERELADGRLEVVLPDHRPLPLPISIVLPSVRHVAARTRALVEYLAMAFANDPLLAPE